MCAQFVFRTLAFRDVDQRDQRGGPPFVAHRAAVECDVEQAPVRLGVDGGLAFAQPAFIAADDVFDRAPVRGALDVAQREREECLAVVTVFLFRRFVDGEEAQSLVIPDPHRQGIVLEQKAERRLPPAFFGDVLVGCNPSAIGERLTDDLDGASVRLLDDLP